MVHLEGHHYCGGPNMHNRCYPSCNSSHPQNSDPNTIIHLISPLFGDGHLSPAHFGMRYGRGYVPDTARVV